MNINDRTINAIQALTFPYTQGETATLTYTINYAAILGNATISASTWASDGPTLSTEVTEDTYTSVTINGSPGRYKITNTVTTSNGETHERIISLTIMGTEHRGDYN